MGKKNDERECLNQALKVSPQKLAFLHGDIIESECPDFLIGDIGLEHFMIEECQNYEMPNGDISDNPNGSIAREQVNTHKKYVSHFNKNPEALQEFINSNKAKDYLEHAVNQQINAVSDFKYSDFIKNFERIFIKHANSIAHYYTKCEKLGFLIEIPYMPPFGGHEYVIVDQDQKRNQRIKGIPFTWDMIQIITSAKVDFLIFYMREVNYTPKRINRSRVIYLDMIQDVEKQLRQQGIVICDKFKYSLTFNNHNVIQFKEAD